MTMMKTCKHRSKSVVSRRLGRVSLSRRNLPTGGSSLRYSFGARILGSWKGEYWPDLLLGGLLTLATFLVHNFSYMMSAPYWNDEAWVAVSTKLPIHQVAKVAASTPVGWDLLLRLVAWGQDPPLRIVPLLFGALTVSVAYVYVRYLPWPRLALARLAAVLAATAALLTPSALVRNDLKQYTADAFVTLVIFWMVARLEGRWDRHRLISLGTVVVVGFMFSAVSAFVGAAAFGCLLFIQMCRRRWAGVVEVLIVGAASGAVLVVVFVLLYRPGIPAGLSTYWASAYVPVSKGWGPSCSFVLARSLKLAVYLGMGPLLLAVALVLAGVVTLIRLRLWSVALMILALLAEMVVLGALKQYPLFDTRTSHFLTTALAVTAAVGVAGLASMLARFHLPTAVVGLAVALLLFITSAGVRTNIRVRSIPAEDLRTPTRYVAAHWRPGDAIVVAAFSSWAFAYYWPDAPDGGGSPVTMDNPANLQGFITVPRDLPDTFVARDRDKSAVDKAMSDAAIAAQKSGTSARIWVVHEHNTPLELRAFADAAKTHGFDDQPVLSPGLDLLTR